MDEGQFFGDPDSFVWRFRAERGTRSTGRTGYQAWHVVYPRAQKGKRTAPANLNFMCGSDSLIMIGGGGFGAALELDSSLAAGFSFASATFGNEPLAGSGNRFEVTAFQVYGFGPEAIEHKRSYASGESSGTGGSVGGRGDYDAAVSLFVSGGSDRLWV